MTESRSTAIVETLRGRIVSGLQAGTLAPGQRLQSARELVNEFSVDHRLIVGAYRQLAEQGLVTIRGRGGVYVGSTPAIDAGFPALPVPWLVGILTEAFAQGIAAPDLQQWLSRSIETLRLRAVAIATTPDQAVGLTHELQDDFGLVAEGFSGSQLDRPPATYPPAFGRADLIVATSSQRELARAIAAEISRPLLVIDVRPSLVAGEWALLLRQPVWAVVEDVEFGEMLLEFFADVPGRDNIRILVLGRDDLSAIPADAPTFVSNQVRSLLAGTSIPGRLLPAARVIATESAREIFDFIVRANINAVAALSRRTPARRTAT